MEQELINYTSHPRDKRAATAQEMPKYCGK
jgi:hypothetical protein